jgi:tetratricopeptide (TPR) repeat protein
VLEENEVGQVGKEDPVKAHRDGTALCDSGNYERAIDKFLQAYQLYEKASDFFDASYVLFKAAECSFFLKNYEIAVERFLKAADVALDRGYDRFGLGALEYAQDCYKAAGKENGKEVAELKERTAEVKKRIEAQAI